ncbi:MAG: RAMP superfamily CRISPR-associated protein, partial [Eubacteriales bacterium]
GVAIDPTTRTAEDKKKYDFELLEAGTVFPLRIELLVREGKKEQLLRGLAIALQGLENGEIFLGARKRRGFGRCRVRNWQVCRYDLSTSEGLLGWLTGDKSWMHCSNKISELFLVSGVDLDLRELFFLEAAFALDGSLLIRSGFGGPEAPDAVHLHSSRGGREVPVLSGTSLAGALRARALRIAKTVGDGGKAVDLVDGLFGPRRQDKPAASRLIVEETEVDEPLEQVVSRVKIDRFTGGSFPAALFNVQPVFGLPETRVLVRLTIQQPLDQGIGLLLLLLKDLWSGDLPLGGEVGVGRGRLRGLEAKLKYIKAGRVSKRWTIKDNSTPGLSIEGDAVEDLEKYIQEFVKEVCESDQ